MNGLFIVQIVQKCVRVIVQRDVGPRLREETVLVA